MFRTLPSICLAFILLTGCDEGNPATETNSSTPMSDFDWQGHRGARGQLPENTIPAFLLALEYPEIRTLELDVVISADSQVVVSHEPWMSAAICSTPDGQPIAEEAEQEHNLYQLPYDTIRRYDCGSRGNARFPEQQKQRAYKPLLADVIAAAEQRARDLGRPLPYYNIELKSQPEWDGVFTPAPLEFSRLVLAVIDSTGIRERSNVQSFDPRILQAVKQLDSTIVLAYLDEETGALGPKLEALGFVPEIYSPYYVMVSKNLVGEVHQRGMKLIPWTVNDTTTMRGLREIGVDGIITDYPSRIVH